MAKVEKTNVMRILDSKKVLYVTHYYGNTDAVSGTDVAAVLGEAPEKVFKTLVTVGRSKQHYVFIIPVEKELDLKKAASAAGEKSIEMIKSKELLPLTGYVHGGCSPIGMKKLFPTFMDESAQLRDTVCISAGKIGYQVECSLEGLRKAVAVECADLIVR